MRLNSVELTNYRCHEHLKVEFAPGFNVIVGVNGSGKTSLLRGIAETLSAFPNGFGTNAPEAFHSQLAESDSVRVRIENFDGRIRFESSFPVEVSAEAIVADQATKWSCSKSGATVNTDRQGSPFKVWQQAQSSHPELSYPLMLFYRAARHWNSTSVNAMQAATRHDSRLDGYAQWWDASLDASALQAWVIGKCLERLQHSAEAVIAFDEIDDDELALVSHALKLAVEGVKGLRYDMKQRSLLVDWHSREGMQRDPTAFANLSDGQRAIIGLVADIARRMCLLNPQLGQDVTLKTAGVVLIDELDLHLHPKWQRRITTGLKRAFPEVQFIVASHSPQVLGELKPGEIILLHPGGTDHPRVSYGLDSSQILEEVMGAEARSPDVEQVLSDLFAALERNELDDSRRKLERLREMAPGIAEIAGAEALLKRKELLGR